MNLYPSIFIAASASLLLTAQAASALTWKWSYSGSGIDAKGTFITDETPDDLGFYQITDIAGTRNGETIIGLQPTGTPIPGNEPFIVDNLVSLNPQQLTGDGFGFLTASGSYSSPFFASFLPTPGYLEVFSTDPIVPGFENLGPEDSELPIIFSAKPIVVPEPSSTLSILTLGTLGTICLFKRRLRSS